MSCYTGEKARGTPAFLDSDPSPDYNLAHSTACAAGCRAWPHHHLPEANITTYRVALDVFEGPLDVLLHLIEREELDITKVSLALVTDQFLAYIAALQEASAAGLADFLVIAAKLLVIKSRSLLPRPEEESEDDEEDLGEQLARQLIEYKRFKQLAEQLRQIEQQGLHTYARLAAPPQIERRLNPGEVSLDELLAALRRALAAHPVVPAVDQVVSPVVVHIADCMQHIGELMQRQRRAAFSALMRSATSRVEIIVTFLAVLEMIKQQRLRATQDTVFGEIYLEARQPDPGVELPPTDLSDYGEDES